MPTHTKAKRAINRKQVKKAKAILKGVLTNRQAGRRKKTVSGLARNAAARSRSRRK